MGLGYKFSAEEVDPASDSSDIPATNGDKHHAIIEQMSEGGKFEVRTMLDENDSKHYFKFLIVDAPEKWEVASSIQTHYSMPSLNDGQLKFKLSGISTVKWDQIETENIIPNWDSSKGDAPPEIRIRQEEKFAARKLRYIEEATGFKIPGDTLSAKTRAMNERCPGEIDALYLYIAQTLCNMNDGLLMDEYMQLSKLKANSKALIKEVNSFEDWSAASNTSYIFRMQRPFQNFILEFPLKGISAESKERIERENKEPIPPQIPDLKPDGGFDPHKMVPNRNDPSWLAKARRVAQKKTTDFFCECLPFKIPGIRAEDQYAWIGERLAGDVYRVKNFIEEEIIGYSSRYNFFSTASSQMS